MGWLPAGAAARASDAAIAGKLADSLAELTLACRGVVAVDEVALGAQCARLRRTIAIRPAVFLLYYDSLAAARCDDAETLALLLNRIAAMPLDAPKLTVRNFADASLPQEEWRRYQAALGTDAPPILGIVAPARFAAAVQLLDTARQAIGRAAPDLLEEMDALTREVVFADDRAAPGFGGATSFQAWGVVYLNARRHGSLVAMANGLVHEAAHALLFALPCGEKLVRDAGDARYSSPLRADKRPMEGIFHATFVSARMCYVLDRLLASAELDAVQRAEAVAARSSAAAAFSAGHGVVEAHATPTPIGSQLLAGAASYMSGRAP